MRILGMSKILENHKSVFFRKKIPDRPIFHRFECNVLSAAFATRGQLNCPSVRLSVTIVSLV